LAEPAKLTVLQLLPALDGGGVERGTLEVAAALAQAGHRSLVISEGGRLVAELEGAGSTHIRWPIGRKSPLTLALVARLRRLLRDQRVAIVHARSRVPAWIAWLAWRGMPAAARPRFVTTVHGLYSVNRYSAVMLRGERIIAVSEAVRDYIAQHYPTTDMTRVKLIHRGVDRAVYPHGYQPPRAWIRDWACAHPELAGKKILTLAGRLSPIKGHGDLIELLAALRARGYPVHGLAVGDPRAAKDPYPERLREAAATQGVELTLLPHRLDLREIMAVSDLILSLSTHPESFGRTVLEGLSLGVPVIGYDHGGVGEILRACFPPGRVAPGDRAALTETASDLLARPPAIPARHPFTLERMLERTLDLYAEPGSPAAARR